MSGGGPATRFGADWSSSLRRGTDTELRGWVEAALGWCDETDAVALRHFRRDAGPTRKPDRSFVTVADLAIESLLRNRISARFPTHGIVGEERGSDRDGASVRWIVDPIDGTHSYVRGVPVFGTLIAVERDGELQAGAISAPALRSRWFAWRGGGAWAAGAAGAEAARRITVSAVDAIADAQVLYASPQAVIDSGVAPGFTTLVREAWRERGYGDFWSYALIAEGAAEVMLEVGLSVWDIAAPAVLVEEAGGRVTDLGGRRAWDSGTFLATNGRIHDTILRRLAR